MSSFPDSGTSQNEACLHEYPQYVEHVPRGYNNNKRNNEITQISIPGIGKSPQHQVDSTSGDNWKRLKEEDLDPVLQLLEEKKKKERTLQFCNFNDGLF